MSTKQQRLAAHLTGMCETFGIKYVSEGLGDICAIANDYNISVVLADVYGVCDHVVCIPDYVWIDVCKLGRESAKRTIRKWLEYVRYPELMDL